MPSELVNALWRIAEIAIGLFLGTIPLIWVIEQNAVRQGNAVITNLSTLAKDMKRAIKAVSRSLPHCHHCYLAARESEEIRRREERERERREKGLVTVSVTCPICQAQWDFDVDREGAIESFSKKTPGAICIEEHEDVLLRAFESRASSGSA